jgi:hypothetical protein
VDQHHKLGHGPLQLTWQDMVPGWVGGVAGENRYCTPLHTRANETGRLFDVDPTKAIVCTGGNTGSMSRSVAVAHDLRTIRDRFFAAPP